MKTERQKHMERLVDWMKHHRVYFDGGMGSLLQEQGLAAGELPETWNLLHPEVLVDIHRSYLEAGANIMTTTTFAKRTGGNVSLLLSPWIWGLRESC